MGESFQSSVNQGHASFVLFDFSKEVGQDGSDQGQDFNEEKSHLCSLNFLMLNSKQRQQLSSLKILNPFSTV